MSVAGSDGTRQAGQQATALRRTLHERGLRMTPQRQLVLDAVRALGHATPEQVCAQVQREAPAVNITTVYRSLDLLERLGLVRHTHLGHGAPNYSVHEHEHVHLVCHGCGRVTEVVYLGTSTNYNVTTSTGADVVVFTQNASSADDIAVRGDDVWLSWQPQHSYAIGAR